jgi:hypothetical protein
VRRQGAEIDVYKNIDICRSSDIKNLCFHVDQQEKNVFDMLKNILCSKGWKHSISNQGDEKRLLQAGTGHIL